jgi:hypothetical protein
MPRALRAFKAAALPEGMQVEAAPMGMAARIESRPSTGYRRKRGFERVQHALHELLGPGGGALGAAEAASRLDSVPPSRYLGTP